MAYVLFVLVVLNIIWAWQQRRYVNRHIDRMDRNTMVLASAYAALAQEVATPVSMLPMTIDAKQPKN
jgi:hypothetical protein